MVEHYRSGILVRLSYYRYGTVSFYTNTKYWRLNTAGFTCKHEEKYTLNIINITEYKFGGKHLQASQLTKIPQV